MIITRTPFRITLGGGGTDLPSFYEQHGGSVFTMAINKFMYIMLHKLPIVERKSILRYSQVEYVGAPEEIRHPLAREAFKLHDLREFVELTSMADMPARTGLGSSGSYLVGLLAAIRAFKRLPIDPAEVAAEACHIEIDVLREPVGKQDQYIAAFGGFRLLEIDRTGRVAVTTVPVDFMTATELTQKARMYYTGVQRSATKVLAPQDAAARTQSSIDHARVVDALCQIKEIGREIESAFRRKDLDAFGALMDDHWRCKRSMSESVSLSVIDELYQEVKREFGVLGGKIIGAGGGGFLMLYCPARGRELDAFMLSRGMPPVTYFPSHDGVRVVSDMTAYDDFEAAG